MILHYLPNIISPLKYLNAFLNFQMNTTTTTTNPVYQGHTG